MKELIEKLKEQYKDPQELMEKLQEIVKRNTYGQKIGA